MDTNIEKAQNLENGAIEMANSIWDKLSAEAVKSYKEFQRVYYPLKSKCKKNGDDMALLKIAEYYHEFALSLRCDDGDLENCKNDGLEILEKLKNIKVKIEIR